MEIITTEQLRAYLKETRIEYESIEQLEGGTANFLWRLSDKRGTMIIKHAEPYVAASAGHMPFPVDRMDFEKAALTILPDHIMEARSIVLPKVYHYDSESRVLSMEDGGPRTLKTAYADQYLNIEKLGKDLGRWLAGFHSNTKAVDIGDNKTAKSIYRYSYANLEGALQKYGQDPALGRKVNDEYGSLLQSDNECVCHGDFWPGNVLLDGQKMTIVDWEQVRRGCGATDVGQFAAEAYLLDRFRGGKGLLPAFLSGYREHMKLEQRFIQRIAVHMGVHLAFWPTNVHWGTEDETRNCVELGVRLITQATANEKGWARGSLLNGLLAPSRPGLARSKTSAEVLQRIFSPE